jgi:hypothetical protein
MPDMPDDMCTKEVADAQIVLVGQRGTRPPGVGTAAPTEVVKIGVGPGNKVFSSKDGGRTWHPV